MKPNWSKIWIVVALLSVANVSVALGISQAQPRDYLELHFFDVGQGDGIYIRTASGNDILIDGGPDNRILSQLGRVMPFHDRSIELVILTHPHADHVAGLVEILKRFKVKQVVVSDISHDTQTYKSFLAALGDSGAEVVRPRLGQRIFLDETTVFDVLFPIFGKFESPPSDLNDASVVGRLSFGEMAALFTGDAGKEIENFLLSADLPISAEILKVGHHGSRHSTKKDFVQKVGPVYSVIQVGKNSYGHPHGEVLGLLEDLKLEILRNDENGNINFKIYPDRIEKF